MTNNRYLTKSRFQLGRQCPTKLFYTGKKEYPDQNKKDILLQSRAEEGYQVGELAKLYFPEGVNNDIEDLDHESAIQRTDDLLKQENVVIFEGAVKYENLFIRADIIVKQGKKVQLIEVKAKSFSGKDESVFISPNGISINPKYKSYLEDVAFQKYVLMSAYPAFEFSAYLMLVNKNSVASVDGLNQIFEIKTVNGRKTGVVNEEKLARNGIGNRLLVQLNVDKAIDLIYKKNENETTDFISEINHFASHYAKDQKIKTPVGVFCKYCEFYTSKEEDASGKKSGFKECWKEQLGLTDRDFERPLVFDVWNYRASQDRIEEGRYFLTDLNKNDFSDDSDQNDTTSKGLSITQRQWIQVEKAIKKDPTPYIDLTGLRNEMNSWKYPLHFIDFETSTVAIPFFKGTSPYEGIAFQYSHHTVSKDGKIEHTGEYLNSTPLDFPNFKFIRNLKRELEKDDGTIFRYSGHENTFLNQIYSQLASSSEPDKQSLMAWIRTITISGKGSQEQWAGTRNMIDLLEIVKQYFYHPLMHGSNSIKDVLPAILNESKYLQTKYSKPIYGTEIKSQNFKDKVWIEFESDGKTIKSPYKLLTDIADGGAALTAYSLLQSLEEAADEAINLRSALLKYCELDTFAMVLLWEYWNEVVGER
jgi:hypothetical protein